MPNPNSLLDEHVVLTCRSMDRIFLNGYVAKLQQPDQLFWFLCQHRGQQIPRYELLGEITRDFVAAVHEFAEKGNIPVITFESKRKSKKRKDDIAKPYFEQAAAQGREGVVLIGIAQERADCFRPPPKRQRVVGRFAASRSSVFVKHIYLYIWDSDFGPAFIRFCTYAPFSVRVSLNGHHWLLQQLRRSGHEVEPLANGVAAVDDVEAMDDLCRRFSAANIQRFFDRWMYRLPNPFTARDRRAGYTYQLSILQLEVTCTQVFDRPLHGRQFFEEVMRDHLDLGRPEQMQLVFNRRILSRRKGRRPARTRIFTQDVDPSLHIGHRRTDVKQYWKLDRGLRTETTFNDTYDFGIGRKLENLGQLLELGQDINRRLLELECQSHCPTDAATQFEALVMPTGEPGRRAPGLRFGDPRVVALYGALSDFRMIFGGFYARDLRPLVEHHLAAPYRMTQMAYDLRRLCRKGLLERIAGSNRYRLTTIGRLVVLFNTRLYHRAICANLSRLQPGFPAGRLAQAWHDFETHLDAAFVEARVAA